MRVFAIIPVIIVFLQCGLMPKNADTPQNRALIAAVEKKDLAGAKKAIGAGADPNILNFILGDEYYDETLLSIAAIQGDLEMVKYLVSSGASVKKEPLKKHNRSSLLWAVKNGHDNVAAYLLENGADPDYCPMMIGGGEGRSDDPPLVYCVNNGNVAMVRKLLEKGAYAKITNREGVPLLVGANGFIGIYKDDKNRVNAYREIIKLLIDKGASVNDQGPLGVAVKNNDIEGVKLLLEKGADIDKETPHGVPIKIALKDKNVEMMVDLIRAGASLKDPVLLEEALAINDNTLLKLMIDKGAPVSGINGSGVPILIRAIEWRNSEIAAYMVNKGADLKIANKKGETPLMYASIYCMADLVNLMIKKGADRKARASGGRTAATIEPCTADGPMGELEHSSDNEVIKNLIAHGAAE